jgi:hypothetical protein
MRLKTTVLTWSVAALSLTGVAFAQQSATLTLRSGEQFNAQLMDLSGVGYTVSVNGQERRIPANDLAAIDFSGGGSVSNSDWDKLSGGGQVLMLKSGENITGQLVDIGGSSPLRMTFRTPSGERDFSSNDVARIVMARPNNVASTPAASNPPASTPSSSAQGVTVNAQQQWTPTGLTVRRGEWVTFSSSGEVKIGGDGDPTVGPNGMANNTTAPGAPVAGGAAGALVGRIGNGPAFMIGNQNRVQMTASGQLFLGVNDGHLPDNNGAFQVQVAREGGAVRRR